MRHGREIPGGFNGPLPPHHRETFTKLIAGEIPRQGLPTVSPVVGAPEALGGKIQTLWIVGADRDRRIPVEALSRIARGRLRLDVDDLAGAAINTHQVSFLPFRIHDVGIARFYGRLMAVCKQGDEPVGVANTMQIVGARRSPLRGVVLSPAIDLVERLAVVSGNLIELGDGQVINEAPALLVVVALIQPTVRANHEIVGIIRTERNRMIVDMLVLVVYRSPGAAAIL